MKTLSIKHIALSVILSMGVSVAQAESEGLAGSAVAASAVSGTALIHVPQRANHAIHGYPTPSAETVAAFPKLIYVDQAYGPAIHSYPHTGSETVTAFNVEYVDTAYGQAIYSYGHTRDINEVEVLPIISE